MTCLCCGDPPPCRTETVTGYLNECQTIDPVAIVTNTCQCQATVNVVGTADDEVLFNGVVYEPGVYPFNWNNFGNPCGSVTGDNGAHQFSYTHTLQPCEQLRIGVKDNGFGGFYSVSWSLRCQCECCPEPGSGEGQGPQTTNHPVSLPEHTVTLCWNTGASPDTFTVTACGKCLVVGPVGDDLHPGIGCVCFVKPADCDTVTVQVAGDAASEWSYTLDSCCDCNCCASCNTLQKQGTFFVDNGEPCCDGGDYPNRTGFLCDDQQAVPIFGPCSNWQDEALLQGATIGRVCPGDEGEFPDETLLDPCYCMEVPDYCQEYRGNCCTNPADGSKTFAYKIASQTRRWLFRWNSCTYQWEKVGQLPSQNVTVTGCLTQTCGANPPQCDCPEDFMCNPGRYAPDDCPGPLLGCEEFP